jgi:hypothetical protein
VGIPGEIVVLESSSVKHRPCADRRTEVEELNHVTNVTNREVDGVSVVTLYGRIVFGEGSNIVREKVKSLIGEGKKKIVLDMKNIDSLLSGETSSVRAQAS